MISLVLRFFCFFFNDTATTEIYTLSLHDALPICAARAGVRPRDRLRPGVALPRALGRRAPLRGRAARSGRDRKSTRLNSSHANISYAVFCLKKKKDHAAFTSSPRQPSMPSVAPEP